jgi:hypothetical protein
VAVRFSADGQDFTAGLALGSLTTVTLACWGQLSVDTNTYACFVNVDNGAGDLFAVMTDGDGTSLLLGDEGALTPSAPLTVGVWYFMAGVMNGTGVTLYVRAADATTWTTVSGTLSGTVNAATLRIGEQAFGGMPLNGCVTGVKVWSAALTQQELDAEMRQHLPARTLDLAAWYPLLLPETTDYSGNARTLTGGVGAVQEDGPGVPWHGGTMVPRVFTDAATGVAYTATVNDTAGVTDTAAAASVAARTVDDTSGATDTAAAAAALDRAVADTTGAVDAVATATAHSRSAATDTAGLADTTATAAGYSRAVSDVAGPADAVSSAVAGARTVDDSAGSSDATLAATAGAGTRTASDVAGLSDTITLALVSARTVDDAAGTADTVATLAAYLRTAADTAGVTDTAVSAFAVAYVRTVSDLLGVSDAAGASSRLTYRPAAGSTARPGSGTTARPYAGVTPRP